MSSQEGSLFKEAQHKTNTVEIPNVDDIPCHDYTFFKQELNRMRKLDDNVIYRLNRTDVVRAEDHVDCAQVWKYLFAMRSARKVLISRCVSEAEAELKIAKADDKGADMEVMSLKKRISVLKSETTVEQILAEETYERFREKCRAYRVPRDELP